MVKGSHMSAFGKVNRERVEKGLPKLKRSEYFTNPKPKRVAINPRGPRKKKEVDPVHEMITTEIGKPMPENKEFEDEAAV